jgi:phosphoglucosamine mutase
VRAKVGDRYVLELMQEKGWILGGENSGHIICLDRHTTGDGTVAALQVLAALRQRGETLAQACADLTMFPQKLINVRFEKAFDWRGDAAIAAAVATAEKVLDGRGRVLLRPSGTEPLLRVMVEGADAAQVLSQAEALAAAVRAAAARAA